MIDSKDIEHVAELARLDLSSEEKARYGKQLGAILEYIDQLKEVDTAGVEPTAQVSGLVDVWRSDEAHDWNREEVEVALNQGGRQGRYIKVKKVL